MSTDQLEFGQALAVFLRMELSLPGISERDCICRGERLIQEKQAVSSTGDIIICEETLRIPRTPDIDSNLTTKLFSNVKHIPSVVVIV